MSEAHEQFCIAQAKQSHGAIVRMQEEIARRRKPYGWAGWAIGAVVGDMRSVGGRDSGDFEGCVE